jgi:hypothetical protein
MAISDEIKSLTEDIEASYETRVAAVSDLAEETHQILGNFKQERERMAGDLKRSLASNRSDRIRQVQEMRAGNSRDFEGVTQTVAEFLAAAEKERMQAFTPLMEEIRSLVTQIENDTARTLADFRREHQEMTEVLRRELASFQSDLSREVSAMMTDFSADHRQAHAEWENLTRVMAAKRAKKSVPASV